MIVRDGPGVPAPYYCPGPSAGGGDTFDSDESDETAPPIPTVIPRYTLLEELGRGGFSVVYRALDQELGREVAIKLLGQGSSPSRTARFLREARALATLEDPGVVPVLDAGRASAGPAWLAMGLVRGPTLDRVIQDAGALAVDEAVRIVATCARTIARVHAQGLRHRDVKPSNILMTPEGAPLLSDFGLALDIRETDRLTRDGHHPGTPAYMAPELFVTNGDPDWALADIYALGMVLSELLLGERPFGRTGGLTPEGSVWLDRLDGRVPWDLAAICRTAAHPDPRRRYVDADAYADDLDRFAARRPVLARPSGWAHRLRLASTRTGSRAVVTTVVGAGIVAALVGIVGMGLSRRYEEAARESTAAEHLVSMRDRRARSIAEGRPEEAEATFQTFVSFAGHQGTRAVADAWLDRGRELAEVAPDTAAPALVRAFGYARAPADQKVAARELAEALARAGRWEALQVLVDDLGGDPGPAASVRPLLRADLALQELRVDDALLRLPPDDPRRDFLGMIRRARREEGLLLTPTPPCDAADLLARTVVRENLVASTRGYDRSLVRIDPATCTRAPIDADTDGMASWTQSLTAADLTGDGRDELVLGMGPPSAYGLRVLDPGGPVPVLLGLQRVGNVAHVARITLDEGKEGVVALTSGRHPSRYAFPNGSPEPAAYVLRWQEDRFVEVARVALPIVDGVRMEPDRLDVADLDGDGDDDITVRLVAIASERGRDATLVLIHQAHGFVPLTLGGFAFMQLDPTDGAPAHLRGIVDGVVWTLGVGDGPPPNPARTPIGDLPAAGGDDPAWRTAVLLARFGFAGDAEADLARFGRTLSGEAGARAWAATATHRRSRGDRAGAADAWREAGRLGHPGGWERAAEDYDAVLSSKEAARAAAAAGAADPLAADRLARLVTDVPAPVELAMPADPAWLLRDPFARSDVDRNLRLESTAGVGSLARVALRRTSGRLAIEVRATFEAQEWGHRLAFRIGPANQAAGVVTFVQVSGGGGSLTRDIGVGEQAVVVVPEDDPAGRPREVRLVAAEARDGSGWLLDVRLDGRHAGSAKFPQPPWTDTADWALEIAAPSRGVEGAYARVRIEQLALGGLTPAGQPDAFAAPEGDEARAARMSELRRDPAGASARLARELGAAAALALVEAAYEAAVTTGPRSRVRDALGGQLVLLSDPRATASRPLLTAWHGLALLDQGDVDGAALSLARAVDAAGDRGEACVVTRGGLALVATARGADIADAIDRMRACAPHPLVGEAWIRELGFGALLATTPPEGAARVR